MNSEGSTHLVQILLPKEAGSGTAVGQAWFRDLVKELTETFGGATSFLRGPGEGLWQSERETERDNIAVIEVMVDGLDRKFWKALRRRLERDLGQDEIVIRAQKTIRL
jgi:hypothetical protein